MAAQNAMKGHNPSAVTNVPRFETCWQPRCGPAASTGPYVEPELSSMLFAHPHELHANHGRREVGEVPTQA